MEQLHIASSNSHKSRGFRDLLWRHSNNKPARGMEVAFKPNASESLGGIPARVTEIWPRMSSGDYLVTLEYPQPVKFRNLYITHIEAFMSDLEHSQAAA